MIVKGEFRIKVLVQSRCLLLSREETISPVMRTSWDVVRAGKSKHIEDGPTWKAERES